MRPTFNRVLLKHLEAPADGMWLPDGSGVVQRGIVVAVGDDVRYCETGDEVLFKTDESVRLRVPIENRVAVPEFDRGTEFPGIRTTENTEELYLVPEQGVYLIIGGA